MIIEHSNNPNLSKVFIAFEIGSHDDPKEQPGLCYFTAENVLRFIFDDEKLGARIERLGGEFTVSVDRTHTTFELTILNDSLLKAIELIKGAFTAPQCSKGEVDILRESTKGEIEIEKHDPIWLARMGTLKTCFGFEIAHPIGGDEKSLDGFTPKDVIDFFQKKLIRSKAFIAISSKEEQAREALLDFYESLEQDFSSRVFESPKIDKSVAVILHKKGMSTHPFFLSADGVADSNPNKILLELGNHAFGGDFTSRLSQELRVKNGWTYYASSGFNQILEPKKEAAFFSLHSAPRHDVAIEAISKSMEMLKTYFDSGLTEREFESSQKSLAFSYLFEIDTAEKRAEWRLRECLTGRKYLDLQKYRDVISRVDRDALNELLGERKDSKYILSVVGDSGALSSRLEKEFDFDQIETIDSDEIVAMERGN